MAEKFDRSKFKATQAATLKQGDSEFTSADYLKLTPGDNLFRIYPFHPDGGGDTFAEKKEVHWLEIDVPEYKDGKPVIDNKGNAILKRASRPIFNSITHGGTPKDLIDEYIAFAQKLAKDNYPGDVKAQEAFLDPINGGFNSKHNGILKRTAWVMYVDKLTAGSDHKVFGRLEIGKAIKYRLNTIAASEGSNDPLGTDPFTDVVDGRAIKITYNKGDKNPQNVYVTELYAPLIPGGKGQITLFPLSDTDLEKFLTCPSLASMFKNSYKISDFRKALNGLTIFDAEHNIGCFQYDAFLNIVEEIQNYYPEETLEEKQRSGDDVKEMFTGKNKPTQRELDVFDDMDRDELKAYCKEERTGIIVINKMSDDDVRNKIRDWHAAQDQEIEEAESNIPVQKTVVAKKQLSAVEQSEMQNDAETGLPWDKDGKDLRPRNGKASVEVADEKSKTDINDRLAKLKANMKKK